MPVCSVDFEQSSVAGRASRRVSLVVVALAGAHAARCATRTNFFHTYFGTQPWPIGPDRYRDILSWTTTPSCQFHSSANFFVDGKTFAGECLWANVCGQRTRGG